MTDTTTVVYRVTAIHPTHPAVVLYTIRYPSIVFDALTTEGYTVTVHRLTTTTITTTEDATNER